MGDLNRQHLSAAARRATEPGSPVSQPSSWQPSTSFLSTHLKQRLLAEVLLLTFLSTGPIQVSNTLSPEQGCGMVLRVCQACVASVGFEGGLRWFRFHEPPHSHRCGSTGRLPGCSVPPRVGGSWGTPPPSSAVQTLRLPSLICFCLITLTDEVKLTSGGQVLLLFFTVFKTRSLRAGEMDWHVRALAAPAQGWSSSS